MSRSVSWLPAALRDMRRLDASTRDRIRSAVYRFAEEGHGDTRKLKGREGEHRLRVGSYRVIFAVEDGKIVILVLRVLHRREAYR